jgi:hypothetical protein
MGGGGGDDGDGFRAAVSSVPPVVQSDSNFTLRAEIKTKTLLFTSYYLIGLFIVL